MNKDKQNKSECECRLNCVDSNLKSICECPCHTQAPQKEHSKWCKISQEFQKRSGSKDLICACGQAPQEEKECEGYKEQTLSIEHTCGVHPLPQKKDTSLVDNGLTITKDTSWEEEFDRLCTGKTGNISWSIANSALKFFVSQQIQKAREETISSVIEEIEGQKMSEKNYIDEYVIAYNQALQDLKTLLKQKIN